MTTMFITRLLCGLVVLAPVVPALQSTRAVAQGQLAPVQRAPIHEQQQGKINAWTVGLPAGLFEGAPSRLAVETARVVDDGTNLHALPIVRLGTTERLYVRGVFTSELIEAIAGMVRELIPTYKGELRRQDGRFAANDFFPGTRLVRNPVLHPHVDLSAKLEPLRTKLAGLVTAPAMAACLRQLDGVRHYIVHQSLLFFAAQTTELHLDSWSVDTAPLGRAHTVWIPLQDLDHRSGVPSLIPWPRGKVVTERELRLRGDGSRDHRYDEYHRALRKMMLDRSPEAVNPLLRMGDIVVWSSLTPHFTLPAQSFPTERLSLQVLIRPAADRWGDFLSQPYDRTSVQIERATEHFSVRVLGKGNVRSAD